MKTSEFRSEIKRCAAQALESVLSEVSSLKLKEIRCESPEGDGQTGFVAYIDVLGRPHALACQVKTITQPMVLSAAFDELRAGAAKLAGDATPVLIAPYLSPEAQAMCTANHAGYLDLVGNARIEVGEVFIGKRTLALRDAGQLPAIASHAGCIPRSVRRGGRARDSAHTVAAA